MMIDLRYLLANDLFIACSLLSSDNFVSYCKDRGLIISRQKLEELEELQIFYPIARIRRPTIKTKIELVNDGKGYKYLGILKEGEEWGGDVKEEYSSFRFESKFALSWLEEGLLWEPDSRPFVPWEKFSDEQGVRHTESYYAIFQCWGLDQVLKMSKAQVSLASFMTNDENKVKEIIANLRDMSDMIIPSLRKRHVQGKTLVFLCQAISNRYFPQTQSDQRIINVSIDASFLPEWDWYEYCLVWNASQVLSDTGLESEKLKEFHDAVLFTATQLDPLERWYDLVSFIALAEKKKLKGPALLAQSLYAMAEMIHRFYQEATGQKLAGPGDLLFFNKHEFYGEGVTDDELRFLEVLTNQYHLNPKPRLLLVVEGPGEKEALPRIAKEAFGIPFARVGIEIVNLEGIENFSGKKDFDKYGALEKFIDYYHNRQTYVLVILDNEGRVVKVRKALLRARSKFNPRRSVTTENLVRLWKTSIEFDNFNHNEIARAMTELSEGRYSFTSQEVAACEEDQKKKKGDPLRKLFHDKLNYTSSKPKLLSRLVDSLLASPEKEKDENGQLKRPMLKLVWEAIDLAALNHQPISLDIWRKSQESGLFGTIQPKP